MLQFLQQVSSKLPAGRVCCGLELPEIARRIEKGERTVQSWEKGCTSPDSDEIMDWCTACGVSPITMFMEMLHFLDTPPSTLSESENAVKTKRKEKQMEKFDQIAYISAYNEATYDRLTLRIPKGQKKVIQDRAAEKGMSVNAYITALIKKDCHE